MTQIQRTERFEARLTPEQKQTLEAAAALRGQKLSEFVVSLAYGEAQRLLSEERLLRVSARDMDVLLEALGELPVIPPKLEAMLRRRTEMLEGVQMDRETLVEEFKTARVNKNNSKVSRAEVQSLLEGVGNDEVIPGDELPEGWSSTSK